MNAITIFESKASPASHNPQCQSVNGGVGAGPEGAEKRLESYESAKKRYVCCVYKHQGGMRVEHFLVKHQ